MKKSEQGTNVQVSSTAVAPVTESQAGYWEVEGSNELPVFVKLTQANSPLAVSGEARPGEFVLSGVSVNLGKSLTFIPAYPYRVIQGWPDPDNVKHAGKSSSFPAWVLRPNDPGAQAFLGYKGGGKQFDSEGNLVKDTLFLFGVLKFQGSWIPVVLPFWSTKWRVANQMMNQMKLLARTGFIEFSIESVSETSATGRPYWNYKTGALRKITEVALVQQMEETRKALIEIAGHYANKDASDGADVRSEPDAELPY